jgi:aryl-alcohol dehydrogenase-like predicted oxidoreductase
VKKRTLGKSGIEVSPICFGGNVLGWTADEVMSFKILDAFVATGYNFIDTADIYSYWAPGNSGGESERILGNWMKARGNRASLIIATKVGGHGTGPDNRGLDAAHILQNVEASLKRLQTDYIDLYQSHLDDVRTPMEETLEAYSKLVRQGKVRIIGASNFTASRMSEASGISRKYGFPFYETLQPMYNLYDRNVFEEDLEPYCVNNGIAVISYFALCSGFLTGKYRSKSDLTKSQRGDRIERCLNARGYRILEALDRVSEDYHSSPAIISLAWLLARSSITAPIASASTPQQWMELAKASEISLRKDTVDYLNTESRED